MSSQQPPTKIGVILFPGFQLLDICGPLDALNLLAYDHTLHLSIIASTLTPVSTKNHLSSVSSGSTFSEAIVPTHTFDTAPDDLEVLILPGGFGSRKEENIDGVIDFIRGYWGKENGRGEKLRWVLTVCTGSAILAKTGVLDGRRATSNKKAFSWVKEQNGKVEWVPKARWVVDGNIWTSSGVAAGIDMIFAWIAEIWGEETASYIADSSEYERSKDSGNDRFAERWNAV